MDEGLLATGGATTDGLVKPALRIHWPTNGPTTADSRSIIDLNSLEKEEINWLLTSSSQEDHGQFDIACG
jgi:hypothetical protein